MSHESSWKRPKGDDDEDELLRQQLEFFKTGQVSSAKLINVDRKNEIKNDSYSWSKVGLIKKRLLAESMRTELAQKVVSTSQSTGEMMNPIVKEQIEQKLKDTVSIVPSNIILGNIIEKKYQIKEYKFDDSHVSVASEIGFPKVFGSDNMKTNGKQSLFSQKILMTKPLRCNSVKVQEEYSKNKQKADIDHHLAIEIHEENLEKLSQISKEDILKEKKILENILNPNIIQFLKNKNEAKTNINVFNRNIKLSSNDDTKIDCEQDSVDIPNLSKDLLEESKQKGWLHMDTPEPEKLKWMEDLSMKDEPTLNEPYNARFDFKGFLLPYKDENLTIDKGLHHHGEEPERPGYSLQELLQLSRSSTQQQRCTALVTLANIMEQTRNGLYDKVLHPLPLNALSQRNILLLLRFSLDDTSVAVVTAALQALQAFLCSEADEICLDRLYGFNNLVEPTLTPQLEDKDTSNLKDHELAQLDAVAALLRSDFLLRIRYILNVMHPPPVGVTSALEILIRVARHSQITALNISSTPHLLDTVIHSFMPLSTDKLAMQDTINNSYGIPVVKAVKLCRVLVTYGKKPVAQKLDNFKIIQIILTYISSRIGKKDDINLCIQSLRLWRLLLHYEVGLDSVAGAQLVLLSKLRFLLSYYNIQNTSELACEYTAALIAVASHEESLRSNISTLLEKWSTQLSVMSNITWGVMKLISETLLSVDNIFTFKTTWMSNRCFCSKIRSNLLSNYKPVTDREPSCLPNLGVLMEGGVLLPIMCPVNSCIPFWNIVLNKFRHHLCVTEIRAIFEEPSLRKYLQDLEAAEWNLERSWYTRIELSLLTAMVEASLLLSDTLDNFTAHILWKIAIKLVSALPADATHHVKMLLHFALSNEKINLNLNLEIVTNKLVKLDLISTEIPASGFKEALYDKVALLYESYVSLSEDWSQAAMPKDWIFLPLVHMYTNCKNNLKLQPEDKSCFLVVLNLALVLPDLIEKLSPSLRFSRLILVYLCDTVYLDKDVSLLLTSVMTCLLKKHYARLDLKTELPGLSSFTDLFTAMCEHFCSSSYGDDGFAMILLVPIAQRHDAHYRKMLWSEHAGALRYLRLPPEKLVVPFKEYLYPEEEDISLIESYITALIQGVVREAWCPIPYAIALHHSAMYLKRSNKLAVQMRTQMKKLYGSDIANRLLRYKPPQLYMP